MRSRWSQASLASSLAAFAGLAGLAVGGCGRTALRVDAPAGAADGGVADGGAPAPALQCGLMGPFDLTDDGVPRGAFPALAASGGPPMLAYTDFRAGTTPRIATVPLDESGIPSGPPVVHADAAGVAGRLVRGLDGVGAPFFDAVYPDLGMRLARLRVDADGALLAPPATLTTETTETVRPGLAGSTDVLAFAYADGAGRVAATLFARPLDTPPPPQLREEGEGPQMTRLPGDAELYALASVAEGEVRFQTLRFDPPNRASVVGTETLLFSAPAEVPRAASVAGYARGDLADVARAWAVEERAAGGEPTAWFTLEVEGRRTVTRIGGHVPIGLETAGSLRDGLVAALEVARSDAGDRLSVTVVSPEGAVFQRALPPRAAGALAVQPAIVATTPGTFVIVAESDRRTMDPELVRYVVRCTEP